MSFLGRTGANSTFLLINTCKKHFCLDQHMQETLVSINTYKITFSWSTHAEKRFRVERTRIRITFVLINTWNNNFCLDQHIQETLLSWSTLARITFISISICKKKPLPRWATHTRITFILINICKDISRVDQNVQKLFLVDQRMQYNHFRIDQMPARYVFPCNLFCYIELHCNAFNKLHYITIHCILLYYIALQHITLHYITLRHITLQHLLQ